MCTCGTVCPAVAPSLIPMLYPAGEYCASSSAWQVFRSSSMAARSASSSSKKDPTCRFASISVCPSETGYASFVTRACAFECNTRDEGRLQNGQSRLASLASAVITAPVCHPAAFVIIRLDIGASLKRLLAHPNRLCFDLRSIGAVGMSVQVAFSPACCYSRCACATTNRRWCGRGSGLQHPGHSGLSTDARGISV